MRNAYYIAIALEAMLNTNTSYAIMLEYAINSGYYYTDEIERYLTSWNCHTLTRLLDNEREEARNEAVDYQNRWDDITSMYEIVENEAYFNELGKRYNLLEEFRENCIC